MLRDAESHILSSLTKINPNERFDYLIKRCARSETNKHSSLPFILILSKQILQRLIQHPIEKIKQIFGVSRRVNSLVDDELVRF